MSEPQTQLENKTGAILLESAVLRFMSTADTQTQVTFATYIEKHQADDNLLEVLAAEFPKFTEILNEEIASTQADLQSLLQK